MRNPTESRARAPGRFNQRRRRLVAASGAVVAAVAVVVTVVAQSASGWELSFRALNAGGTSSGGTFATTGVIGQPLTGASTGGAYSVASGFYGGGGQEKFKRLLPHVATDGTQP
ncbi:MAG: hypothetical protein ACKVT1_18525 [Dehalococcoidia bacterium]